MVANIRLAVMMNEIHSRNIIVDTNVSFGSIEIQS